MKGVNADEAQHEKPTRCILNTCAFNTKSLGPLLAQQQHLPCASSRSMQVLPYGEKHSIQGYTCSFGPINNISFDSDANE